MTLRIAVFAIGAALWALPAQAYVDQPPPGDYWRTCRNVNLDGYGSNVVVSASCRDDRGQIRNSSLAFDSCRGPVTTRNGQLVCARPDFDRPEDRRGNGGYNRDRSGPGTITLYPGPQWNGQELTVKREFTNLPRQYNDRAMSLRVRGGTWQICADSDFRGRCETIDRDVANLNDLGLGEAISSIRQVR